MRILTLPGWQNSGPEHWQSQWERLDARTTRIEQEDWDRPELATWATKLHAACTGEPTVLAAHSLGSLLVVHEAQRLKGIVGALLVAPPDIERFAMASSFAPVPRERLPFPSIFVASEDDRWCLLAKSRDFAEAWGSRLINLGPRGHLNSESGLGHWPEGRALLRELASTAPFSLDPRLAADTHVVGASALNLLLMMNDARYPWFILVPRRSGVAESYELTADEQRTLAEESAQLAAALKRAFRPDKLNVGALGNVVQQLHVHHVARTLGDPAWPGPVWGHSPRVPRDDLARARVLEHLFAELHTFERC
jgi:predicted alpha/beta hydrolase family esterase/diadenosine tetraphosphate (Ap4A) HIT family hydrolase